MEMPHKQVEEVMKAVLRDVTQVFELSIPDILKTWADVYDSEEIVKRINILKNRLADILQEEINHICESEAENKNKYVDKIETLLEEIRNLNHELGVIIPFEDVGLLPLHNMALELNSRAEQYRTVRAERLAIFNELKEKETDLAHVLGEILPSYDDLPPIPSEAELNTIQKRINHLEDVKSKRVITFLEDRQKIKECMDRLGEIPKLNFEEEVISDDRCAHFKVTEENMYKLRNLRYNFENKIEEAVEKRQHIVQKLRAIWDYLEESVESQQEFLRLHPGLTFHDFHAMQTELERCNKEKSANIGKFVERIRKDIQAQWDLCLVSNETRAEFRAMNITTYNEDLYNMHELELNRWKNFYSMNSHIFDLIGKHKVLFNKLIDLDGLQRSATRYHNRGGQLLQEERQRKAVFKELPKAEEDLRAALANYELVNSQPFTSYGIPLTQVLDHDWSTHFDQRTIDKFRGGSKLMARTPLAVKRPANTPSSAVSNKVSRLLPKSASSCRTRSKRSEEDKSFMPEPTYEDFQRTLRRNMASRSTELINELMVPTNAKVFKSTPNIASALITPKTVPKAAKRGPISTPKRPHGKNRLPLIL